MHRGRERASYIPFPLNPETRSDVIPVRLHFRETIPQARQPISHRRVCVNNGMVGITHLRLSHGDIISFQENDARIRGEEIRRSFYIEISVEKIIGKENRKDPTSIYGLPREPLGVCCRMDEEVFLQGKENSELGAFLYEFDEKVANSLYDMLLILAKYLKVEKAQVYFVKPQIMVQ